MLKPSERGRQMPESPIRKLAPLADEAARRGTKVHYLNIGQPDLPTPQEGIDAMRSLDRRVLEYSPSAGRMSLREALVGYYAQFGIGLSAEEIMITTGGSEALLFGFFSCLNAGDEIIIPEPAYANYLAFAMTTGLTIVPFVSKIETGFALPPIEELEALITPRTKAILICNPNNPTGYCYTKEEMLKIGEIVRRHRLFLFADEVYREFCYSDEPHFSALSLPDVDDNVVLIDSFSKRYNECGIRIGALVTRNRAVLSSVMKYAQARLSPPLLGQMVAEASMRAPQSYLDGVYREYVARRDLLIEGLNSIDGVYSPLPQGAFYTTAQLPIDDSDSFCAWMLSSFTHKGQTVMMAPATGFYTNPEHGRREVRIAYVLEQDALRDALEVLEAGLKAYPGRLNK